MDRRTAMYEDFVRVCGLLDVPEERMRGEMRRFNAKNRSFNMRITNKKSEQTFLLKCDAAGEGDTFRLRLYEAHGSFRRLIFAKFVSLTKAPKKYGRRYGAFSSIAGSIMVLSIVIGAGAIFWYALQERAVTETEGGWIEVGRADILVDPDINVRGYFVSLDLTASHVMNVQLERIGGDAIHDTLFDGDELNECVTSHDGSLNVCPAGRGMSLSLHRYYASNATRDVGEWTAVTIGYGADETERVIVPAEVRGP